MTSKELMYVDDALSHAQFLANQFQTAADQLTDSTLKQTTRMMADRYRQIYQRFYNLV